MNTKTLRNIALAALLASTVVAHALAANQGVAKSALRYEPATDAEVAAYFAPGQSVVTCVAADTASGCK